MKQGSLSRSSPFAQFMIFIFLVIIGTFLTGIFTLVGFNLFHLKMGSMLELSNKASLDELNAVRLASLVQDVCLFIIPSVLFSFLFEKKDEFGLLKPRWIKILPFILIIPLWISIFPFLNVLSAWNESMVLPHQLSKIEKYFKEMETGLDKIIEQITNTHKPILIFTNIISIALFPAISEEFIFRGVLQTLVIKLFRRKHLAIFLVAIIFSAIHMQFYGFLPRFILGLLLGYLYYWSKSIWLGIFFHFINNGTEVYLSTIPSLNHLDEKFPVKMNILWGTITFFSLSLACIFLYWIYKKVKFTPSLNSKQALIPKLEYEAIRQAEKKFTQEKNQGNEWLGESL